MVALASFVCGLIFGLGLVISGMTQPQKVLGFLDIFGRWDPTLALVMASGPHSLGCRLCARAAAGAAHADTSALVADAH